MRPLVRGALALTIVLLAAPLARGACTSRRCADSQGAVDAVRLEVARQCDCAKATTHKGYVRCATGVIKAAMRDGGLPRKCKDVVRRCEAQTTCGMAGAQVCCAITPRGKVRGRVMRDGGHCRGNACADVPYAVDACTNQGACVQTPKVKAFRSIQQVFSTSCALSSCHSALARKGELVLDYEDLSYQNLVDRPAVNPEAQAMGLMRVKSGDPANSFLIRKLRGLGPGDSMPQASPQLPEPIIRVIEDWIARGAHTTAEECPALAAKSEIRPLHGGPVQTVCDEKPIDQGPFVWKPEPPLEVPAPDEGIQLYVPSRPVAPGTEWEECYAFRPNWQQIAAANGLDNFRGLTIKEQVYRMHQGSHHLLLYAYFGQYPDQWPHDRAFPCFAASCVNPADCPPDSEKRLPIGGTQVAGIRYEVSYPQGVGIPVLLLSDNVVLIANVHYTNPFQPPQPIHGEAWLNLYFYDPGQWKVLLDGIFAINYRDMFVEPYETKTLTHMWSPRSILTHKPIDAAVFQLFGHMHKRGRSFQIDYVKGGQCSVSGDLCGRDDDCACKPYETKCTPGQTCVRQAGAEDTMIYHTTEWDNAPVVDFPKPYLLINRDEGLRWTCVHQNGSRDDPNFPPKRCTEGCKSCGWTGGRCSTNGKLCRSDVACEAGETCVADEGGLSPSGFRCKAAADATPQGEFCCPGECTSSADARVCWFTRGVDLGYEQAPRAFPEGEPMPLVFGELADDDMCNMFGYQVDQASLPLIE